MFFEDGGIVFINLSLTRTISEPYKNFEDFSVFSILGSRDYHRIIEKPSMESMTYRA